MPRSVAQFLEPQIAEREREKGRSGRAVALRKSATTTTAQTNPSSGFASPVTNTLLVGITPSFLGLSTAVPLARCVVAGTLERQWVVAIRRTRKHQGLHP